MKYPENCYFGLLQDYGRICMKTYCSKKMRLDETFHLIPLLYIPKCYHFQDKSKKLLFLGYFGLLQEYGRICIKTSCSKKMRLNETFNLIPPLYIPKTYELRDKCQKPTFLGTVGLRQDLHKNFVYKKDAALHNQQIIVLRQNALSNILT